MRKPTLPLLIKLALLGIFLTPSLVHAALYSATWVAGAAGGTHATGTMGTANIDLTTIGVGNSTQIFPGTWQQILPPSLGTLYPDAAISIGYNCNNSAQNQSVTFTTSVTNPYLLFNYVDGGSVYDFSSIAGTVTLVGNTVGATLSSKVITLPAGSFNRSNTGFAIQLSGTYSSISYSITNSSCASGHDSAGFDVAETGFSITPTVGPHGAVSPNQVITVLPNTKASFTVTHDNGYVANMGGTCGGTLSGNIYTTSTVTQDCTVTASFVTNPQNALSLNANPTGINVSSSSTLSTTGGSGTGAVSYTVSGPCTISGNSLTGTAAGSCVVTATKAGDVTFAPATSNSVTVDVSLAPQSGLILTASNTGITAGATSSTLSTTGGSGSGFVSYYLISGPCTLNGAVVTSTVAGECKLGANKAADGTYSLIASNEVTIHVDLAPQATLELHADKTGIVIGQSSYLSTTGGSGIGSVFYSVIDGPCTITASVLHGLANGTCKIQATKFADPTYNQTTSNIVNVFVDLDPQQTLYLYPNPTYLPVNGVSALVTSGGSGTGSLTYTLLSGPCSLSGNQLTGLAPGLCEVSATKAADSTFAATTSNIRNVLVVLAPQAALNLTASNSGIAVGSTTTLSTSGGSGTGTVTYQVLSGPCTLNGPLLSGRGAGTCLLLATKAGDGAYAETSSNEASVYVSLAPQPALTLIANPTGITIGGISGLATSGGSGSGIVTYTVTSGPCTLSGNQLTGKAAGLCQVTATKAADSTYAAITSNIESVYVVLAPQAPLNLTASNTGITVGATSTLSTSGGSGTGTVAYRVISGPCTLNGAVLKGLGAGTCRVLATKAPDGTYAETSSNEASVYVSLAPQSALTLIANPTGITIGGISGLATSGGSGSGIVTYKVTSGPCTLSGNQLTGKAAGLCQVTATKAADSIYAAITSNIESVYVVLAPQTALTLIANPTTIIVGGTSNLSTLGGSGSGNVTYRVLNGPCTISATVLSGSAQGNCDIQATKASDGTYTALSSNTVRILVSLAPQGALILSASNPSISLGSTSTLSTSGGSGNGAVSYRVTSGPCTLNGALLTGAGAGTCLMTASKAADGSFGETISNTVSVLVNLIPQSGLNLSASTLSLIPGGTATLTVTGGSGSGAVFDQVLSGPCTLNGNILVGRGPGTCVVRASKAQADGYAETTSNSVTVSVTAPSPTPAPIPTLSEWAKISMMFLMVLMVGWHRRRLQR